MNADGLRTYDKLSGIRRYSSNEKMALTRASSVPRKTPLTG